MSSDADLLSDPFLQNPTADSVRVVWFTEFSGTAHTVRYGLPGQENSIRAASRPLSRVREDQQSQVPGRAYDRPTRRPIWRHEAAVTGLTPGQRLPYQVLSQRADGTLLERGPFTLAPTPPAGQPLKILLTSDHQLMPMTAANLQKVQETVGQVDAVLMAGDLVNVPDRASEWFDDARGGAFFPCLQGRAQVTLEHHGRQTVYRGGELIQHAPLFPAVGNHEVMGRYREMAPLNEQFNDPVPQAVAEKLYAGYADLDNPQTDLALRQRWLKDNTFNTDTYGEIFSLPHPQPTDSDEPPGYYAVSFGDIRLISLYVTQIWRPPDLKPTTRGRYRERQADLGNPVNWGHGQHIFERIDRDSPQYAWLQRELTSDAFRQAKYKLVMLHHPPHTLGGNSVPAFTDPVRVDDRNPDGSLRAIRYEYPQDQDYIVRDLLPLLEQAGVQFVFYGHSHLWNRFVSASGMHFLESSNVGNTYGAHDAQNPRPVPQTASDLEPYRETYVAVGDPNGLTPVMPTLVPLTRDRGERLPYIASNDMTVFSIFETGSGTVSSYYFDTRQPDSAVVKFDQFAIRSAA
jgi:hypothetical protein